ncbi:MAG: hypothetical protein ABI840_01590 [bacterium]
MGITIENKKIRCKKILYNAELRVGFPLRGMPAPACSRQANQAGAMTKRKGMRELISTINDIAPKNNSLGKFSYNIFINYQ